MTSGHPSSRGTTIGYGGPAGPVGTLARIEQAAHGGQVQRDRWCLARRGGPAGPVERSRVGQCSGPGATLARRGGPAGPVEPSRTTDSPRARRTGAAGPVEPSRASRQACRARCSPLVRRTGAAGPWSPHASRLTCWSARARRTASAARWACWARWSFPVLPPPAGQVAAVQRPTSPYNRAQGGKSRGMSTISSSALPQGSQAWPLRSLAPWRLLKHQRLQCCSTPWAQRWAARGAREA